MLVLPEVDISKAHGDVYKMVDLCIDALRVKGRELDRSEEYENAINTIIREVSDSKAYIRTLAILGTYCRILK